MSTLFCMGNGSSEYPPNTIGAFVYAHNKLDELAGGDLIAVPNDLLHLFEAAGRHNVKVQLLDGTVLDAVADTRPYYHTIPQRTFTLVVLPDDLGSIDDYYNA